MLFNELSVEVHFQRGLGEVRPVSKGWRKSHQSIPKQEPRDITLLAENEDIFRKEGLPLPKKWSVGIFESVDVSDIVVYAASTKRSGIKAVLRKYPHHV